MGILWCKTDYQQKHVWCDTLLYLSLVTDPGASVYVCLWQNFKNTLPFRFSAPLQMKVFPHLFSFFLSVYESMEQDQLNASEKASCSYDFCKDEKSVKHGINLVWPKNNDYFSDAKCDNSTDYLFCQLLVTFVYCIHTICKLLCRYSACLQCLTKHLA